MSASSDLDLMRLAMQRIVELVASARTNTDSLSMRARLDGIKAMAELALTATRPVGTPPASPLGIDMSKVVAGFCDDCPRR